MLITFAVKNWRAFKGWTILSMRASREKADSERLAKLPSRYGTMKVLPATAIYGANASGKSSLMDALALVQKLVVKGNAVTQMIPVEPFRLDKESKSAPTSFKIEVLIDELIYVYELSCTRADVIREKLVIRRTRTDQLVFERNSDGVVFGKRFDGERVRLVAENTRSNQLFLHNAVAQNADAFRPLFDWFDKSLTIIGADAEYSQYSQMLLRPDFLSFVNERLRRYNTGAVQIDLAPIVQDSVPVPAGVIEEFVNSVPEGKEANLQIRSGGPGGSEIFIIRVCNGESTCSKVKTVHFTDKGERVTFDLSDESRGTQKLIELLPLFFDLAADKDNRVPYERVYLVDEMGGNFHSALTIDLVRKYLECCNENTRNQLIFSTHDLIFMTERVLRRDALWVCEKNSAGVSTTKCVGGHPGIRADTDLLKNYRNGLFGGYPTFCD